MSRRYGEWAGNPRGSPEDATRCVVEVAVGGRSVLFHQCSRKRGKGKNGDLCGIHARVEARDGHLSIPPNPVGSTPEGETGK